MDESRKIFVAGATGVLGRRLIPRLVAAGHQVSAVARTPEKGAAISAAGATPVRVDLFDPTAVHAAVLGHEVVINLATRIPPSSRALLPWAWRENDRLRQVAAKHLAIAARSAGASRLIQESIAMIYKADGDRWIAEDSPVLPARHTRAALGAEDAAQGFAQGGGAAVVLRFANFYCAESGHTRDMIRAVERGWAPTFGSADGFIASIACEDAAEAVVAALGVPAGTYNLCDDEPLRRQEYFTSLAEALGVAPPRVPPPWIVRLAGPVGETVARSQRVSNRTFRRASGWAPRLRSAREGWQELVAARTGSL